MKTYRILHLSDLHFGRTPDLDDLMSVTPTVMVSEAFARLRSLWEHGEWLETGTDSYRLDAPCSFRSEVLASLRSFVHGCAGRISGTLVTGDLSRTGLQLDLEAARDLLRTVFAVGYRSATMMPGNHDRWVDQVGTPGGILFDGVFGSHWSTGLGGVQHHSFDPVGATGPAMHVLCADLALRNEYDAQFPLQVYCRGQGHAYQDTVDELSRLTAEVRSRCPGSPIVWASHFPPRRAGDLIGSGNPLALVRDDRLIDAAVRSDVRLILAGHVHELRSYEVRGVNIISAGSASCRSKRGINSIHMLEIVAEGKAEVSVSYDTFEFDNERSGFAHLKERAIEIRI